jgi:hypothetical protein
MAEKLLDGWSFIRIAAWLNDSGALTNMDRARVAKGQEPKRRPWTVSTVIDALTSPRTQGLKMHKGETVLEGNGEPISLALPTFDADTWQKIQQAATLRQLNQRTPTGSNNPMLGVGACAVCGASLAQQVSRRKQKDGTVKVHRYYRCGRTPLNCKGLTILAEWGDQLLEETFLDRYGDNKITRKVFVPGEDHSHELDRIRTTIDRLRRESDAGLVVSDDDERVYLERMKSLIEQRTKLEAMPSRSAGWVIEETDQTYREVWPDASDAERHKLLIDGGVKFVLNPSPGGKAVHIDLLVP